eukprot:comp4533_c0_seq1/m.3197 comp4533_c0_seq1/g.3197  ORF comp4533_c0_seq1/g.3197 comp4533_c0_seq1/m.3197 type:complete len:441 (-) comp4533_c0_seq1:361-1683(-)
MRKRRSTSTARAVARGTARLGLGLLDLAHHLALRNILARRDNVERALVHILEVRVLGRMHGRGRTARLGLQLRIRCSAARRARRLGITNKARARHLAVRHQRDQIDIASLGIRSSTLLGLNHGPLLGLARLHDLPLDLLLPRKIAVVAVVLDLQRRRIDAALVPPLLEPPQPREQVVALLGIQLHMLHQLPNVENLGRRKRNPRHRHRRRRNHGREQLVQIVHRRNIGPRNARQRILDAHHRQRRRAGIAKHLLGHHRGLRIALLPHNVLERLCIFNELLCTAVAAHSENAQPRQRRTPKRAICRIRRSRIPQLLLVSIVHRAGLHRVCALLLDVSLALVPRAHRSVRMHRKVVSGRINRCQAALVQIHHVHARDVAQIVCRKHHLAIVTGLGARDEPRRRRLVGDFARRKRMHLRAIRVLQPDALRVRAQMRIVWQRHI